MKPSFLAPGALLLLMTLSAGPGSAGTVEGTIQVPPPPVPDAGADLYGKYNPSPVPRNPQPGPYAVVSLRPQNAPASHAPAPAAVMDQSGTRFVPRILPVEVGSEVKFLNSDPLFHNVFSLSPAKKFDLGRYPRGASKSVTFDTPGVVQVFCDIHSQMVGFVVVTESPYFTLLAEDGSFHISEVPSGDYSVVIWAEGMNRFETLGEVEVPGTGTARFVASVSR